MKIQDYINILGPISDAHDSSDNRYKLSVFRQNTLVKLIPDNSNSIVKLAFDTRRINQEIEINPRRNLQYYHRSEPFISKDQSQKIENFLKLKASIDNIKQKYIGSPEWLDSYCRVLSSTVDRILRIAQKDFDYSSDQLNYLEELIYLRYRIAQAQLENMTADDIVKIVLSKDEKLSNLELYAAYDAPSAKIINGNSSIDKLFDDLKTVKANINNKDVERSITITVRDKINDDIKKES